MGTEWYYAKGDEQIGPVSLAELKDLLASGKLSAADLVWREGLDDWQAASTIGLTETARPAQAGAATPSSAAKPSAPAASHVAAQAASHAAAPHVAHAAPPSPPAGPATARSGPSEATGKRLWEQTKRIAADIGRTAVSAAEHSGAGRVEDLKLGGGPKQPAVFMTSSFFGGRSRIPWFNAADAKKPGFYVLAALFSWWFIALFLGFTTSGWQFLPFSRTEYVRIVLRERILKRLLLFPLLVWSVIMLVGIIVIVLLAALAEHVGGHEAFGYLALLVFLATYVAANLAAWWLVSAAAPRMKRSQIVLSYGFPRKQLLLRGLSDAPVEQQLEGVLKLCEAISKTEFSKWEQFSVHGRSGMLAAIYSKISDHVG